MKINQESRIVEVFSADLLKTQTDKNELKDANEYIRELASTPNPNNLFEMAQILSYVINDGLVERIRYIEDIADVKRTAIGEKAQFQIDIDDLKAMFQAKSSSTVRSKVSTRYFTIDTDEVSIRPVVNFYDIQTGKVNFTSLAQKAVVRMDNAIAKRIQDATFTAFSAMATPNYSSGSGVVASTFDPILSAMIRAGGAASIVGDYDALTKFTPLVGYNNFVADQFAVQANENGVLGTYKKGKLVVMNNPFQANSITNTELRKDLIYVIPSGAEELRPIKVQLEGTVQSISAPININSKEVEMRFDQYVGVSAIGVRKLMGVYRDTTL